MRTLKVRLYIRVRLPDGRYPFLEPVWNRNRTLRQAYALLDGQPTVHPGSCYYLRFRHGQRQTWQSVGPDADAALAALRSKEHELQSIALGLSAIPRNLGNSAESPSASSRSTSISVEAAVARRLQEVHRFRAQGTLALSKRILSLFGQRYPGRSISSIDRQDLLDHMFALKQMGLSDRTIYNHMIGIGTLLKSNGVARLLSAADMPQYEEKDVEAYNDDQLAALFAAASPEELILFQFFLYSGLREQEVMFTSWRNIDFKGKVVAVRSKPEMGFKIKDKEERSVPVPDSLIAALLVHKQTSDTTLLFPGRNGKPNGHFLRALKNLALRAGLNCGECMSKGHRSCRSGPVCRDWSLHKFRRTFATFHSRAGISVTDIQSWLGHADLATTQRYLAAASLRSERTRSQVNASFDLFTSQGAA